jgi:hypothetical protein
MRVRFREVFCGLPTKNPKNQGTLSQIASNDLIMCRYAPHFGLVRPFMFTKGGLPSVKKTFPGRGPLNTYLADFKEIVSFGMFTQETYSFNEIHQKKTHF